MHIEKWGPGDSQPASSGPGQDAGTVASFTGGVLTITLGDGSTVKGTVTQSTRLECEAAEPAEMQNDDHGNGHSGTDGQGDGHPGDGAGEREAEAACTTGVLAQGATIRSAELTVSGTGATWDEIDVMTAQGSGGDS